MKRITAVLLTILILFCGAAIAEEENPAYNFYRSLQGRISFTLPDMPTILREVDYDDFWTDNVQMGGKLSDGGEYQIHTANLSPRI
ncbi:MAG: hypothetical protein PHI27_13160 [Eubacteriales bacterium]|nr:hypothetical protein [Eubacteriales bacterium]MDD3883172.1 hypothetical protein [Eubacteriales bacterium]MDD4512445.1 hypothetical protein [Eubacteriales bacterium]